MLRTAFVTHEQLILQYSMYNYKGETEANLPHPFGGEGSPFPTQKADKHVLTISATMWW